MYDLGAMMLTTNPILLKEWTLKLISHTKLFKCITLTLSNIKVDNNNNNINNARNVVDMKRELLKILKNEVSLIVVFCQEKSE